MNIIRKIGVKYLLIATTAPINIVLIIRKYIEEHLKNVTRS